MNPDKIHPSLQKELEQLGVADVEGRGGPQMLGIIVKYNPNAAHPTAIGSPHRIFDLLPATAQAATRAEIEALSERPDVAMIWLDGRVHTCLDQSVPLIGAPQIWNSKFTGRGIKVAIVDTGIDTTHPDFGTGRIVALKDFTASPTGISDHVGHGTHVACTIAGAGPRYRGVAWECTLIIAKVLGDDGGGSMSGVMSGIDWAVGQGAKVINLSLGADENGDGTDALSAMCDAAVDRGVCVCVANGNAGPGQGTVGSPACARKVISVGASSKQDQIADFSGRGPTADGRTKPDICFPGVNIVAAQARGTQMGTVVAPGYISASGTSMATPHCAGTAALLLQACPTLTPAQIKQVLAQTAKDLGQAANTEGSGRAQDYSAYQAIAAPTPTPTPVMGPGAELVDVSQYQGAINWPVVKRALEQAAPFPAAVVIRASFATSVDVRFQQNWSASRSAGVRRGCYHYFSALVDPVAQARVFAGLAQGGDLPYSTSYVLDVEDNGGLTRTLASRLPPQTMGSNYLPPDHVRAQDASILPLAALSAHIKTFLDEFEALTGQECAIYTSPGFWNAYVSAPWAKLYALWVAHWNVARPTLPRDWALVSPWLWQYAVRSDGLAFGMQSRDLDHDRWMAASALPPTPPAGAPEGFWDAVNADLPNRVLLSIYTDGALWKEGQRQGLGPARSGEIDLPLAGRTFAYQVFNAGVTACLRPDYATIWSYRFAPASSESVESLWMRVLRWLAQSWRR